MIKWLYLISGGAIGTAGRHLLSNTMHRIFGPQFPFGTMSVNLLGCFLIGVLAIAADKKFVMTEELKLFFIVGFLGAFTTFSTFMMETAHLIRDGESWLALWNVLISVVVGFLFFRGGVFLGQII
jgi:CrcB protein